MVSFRSAFPTIRSRLPANLQFYQRKNAFKLPGISQLSQELEAMQNRGTDPVFSVFHHFICWFPLFSPLSCFQCEVIFLKVSF